MIVRVIIRNLMILILLLYPSARVAGAPQGREGTKVDDTSKPGKNSLGG